MNTGNQTISPTLYVLIDTNLLAGYHAPQTFGQFSKTAAPKIQNIIDAVRRGCAQNIRLITPEICVAETQTVLSKHANPKWKDPSKRRGPQRIHGRTYQRIVKNLFDDLHGGKLIESIPLQRYHVLAKHLITPIDHRLHLRLHNGGPDNSDLGGADQLICGIAIWLCRFLGRDRLVVITADRRMAKVLKKAHKTSDIQAENWGLVEMAEEKIGIKWSREVYPQVIHLPSATDRELRNIFGCWPLPIRTRKTRIMSKRCRKNDLDTLISLYKAMGIPRDRLPYSENMKQLTAQFNQSTGLQLFESDVWNLLMKRLKKGLGSLKQSGLNNNVATPAKGN